MRAVLCSLSSEEDAAASDITDAVWDEALTVGAAAGLPITRFPLEQTSAAHDAVEAAAVGKVLIDVADQRGT